MLPKRQLKGMLNRLDLTDHEAVRAFAGALAEQERDQREAVRALFEAHGLDEHAPPPTVDQQERIDALAALLDARISGDLGDYWREHQAPRLEGVDVDAAAEYRGISAEQWEGEQRSWARAMRKQGAPDGADDRDLVAHYVSERFGLALEDFERLVVDMDDAAVMRHGMRHPTDVTVAAMEGLAGHVADLPDAEPDDAPAPRPDPREQDLQPAIHEVTDAE